MITYSCLVKLRTDALWAVEMWNAQATQFETVGAATEAVRYYKILNRIEAAMWKFPATNTLIRGKEAIKRSRLSITKSAEILEGRGK